MSVFKVTYTYAAPTGALRSGSHIIEAEDAEQAKSSVRQQQIGKLRYLNVTGATPYAPDQIEMPLSNKKK